MGIEYKVFKIGLYWFVIISIENTKDIYLLQFMKGNTFGLLEAYTIKSNIINYKDRLNDNLWKSRKEEIIKNSNYLKNEIEVEINDDKVPSRLISKIIKFVEEKSKT